MIHLIAFARINNEQFAYDYIVNDNEIDKVINRKRELFNSSKKEFKYLYTFHIRNHQGTNFESIQEKDPYFANTHLYSSFTDFLTAINMASKLTSLDVTNYVLRKYPALRQEPFSLQKVIYYIYADYLEKYHHPLFDASFVAYAHGPVEPKVYGCLKYKNPNLLNNLSFELKIKMLPNVNEIISLINDDVTKYQPYYKKVWTSYNSDNAKYNLTHKIGTPWYIAYQAGQNTTIKDSDILKYHNLEVLK